ncbi:chemotaxis protein CheW [Bremerella cremea]|nr:chemotaxis protein CheW [Bremerella cremea]
MSATKTSRAKACELQLATFYVGDLLLALPIDYVQEINRNLDLTEVPHAPEHVRGVINLRGDVATVIDLRRILGFSPAEVAPQSRNLIVRSGGESIGLWVDQIADIITVSSDEIGPAPANVSGVEGRFFKGVYRTETDIVVLLDTGEALSVE